jgi:hypothetical protein
LGQFLKNEDETLIKLNDFNRAEFMLWDEKAKDYCKYGEGTGNGNVSFGMVVQLDRRQWLQKGEIV